MDDVVVDVIPRDYCTRIRSSTLYDFNAWTMWWVTSYHVTIVQESIF